MSEPPFIMSSNGLAVTQYFETLRLQAYPDPASPLAKAKAAGEPYAGLSGAPWTIGYGDCGPDVTPDLVITKTQANIRLARRVALELSPMLVKALRGAPTTQGQFDALIDLLYNVGPGVPGKRDGLFILKSCIQSKTWRMHMTGQFDKAAEQLLGWDLAGGQPMLGLIRRCAARKALYEGKSGTEAIRIGAAINH